MRWSSGSRPPRGDILRPRLVLVPRSGRRCRNRDSRPGYFFHNIGHSIENLKRADVVIVGSSLVAFAIDSKIAKAALGNEHGLSFYNMSFVGVSSGEFTKRIVVKYNIHPKLWIINADDGGGGGNFFDRGI